MQEYVFLIALVARGELLITGELPEGLQQQIVRISILGIQAAGSVDFLLFKLSMGNLQQHSQLIGLKRSRRPEFALCIGIGGERPDIEITASFSSHIVFRALAAQDDSASHGICAIQDRRRASNDFY